MSKSFIILLLAAAFIAMWLLWQKEQAVNEAKHGGIISNYYTKLFGYPPVTYTDWDENGNPIQKTEKLF